MASIGLSEKKKSTPPPIVNTYWYIWSFSVFLLAQCQRPILLLPCWWTLLTTYSVMWLKKMLTPEWSSKVLYWSRSSSKSGLVNLYTMNLRGVAETLVTASKISLLKDEIITLLAISFWFIISTVLLAAIVWSYWLLTSSDHGPLSSMFSSILG